MQRGQNKQQKIDQEVIKHQVSMKEGFQSEQQQVLICSSEQIAQNKVLKGLKNHVKHKKVSKY